MTTIKTEVGAYTQPDVEAMTDDDLRAVHDMAAERFDACFEAHDDYDAAASCEACGYYEELAGAADDLLLERGDDEEGS